MTSFEAFDGHSWAMKDKTVILEKKIPKYCLSKNKNRLRIFFKCELDSVIQDEQVL